MEEALLAQVEHADEKIHAQDAAQQEHVPACALSSYKTRNRPSRKRRAPIL